MRGVLVSVIVAGCGAPSSTPTTMSTTTLPGVAATSSKARDPDAGEQLPEPGCAVNDHVGCVAACEAGEMLACIEAVLALDEGRGTPAQRASLGPLLEKGCAGGALYACQLLAEALASGKDLTKDAARLQALVTRTYPLLETKCRAGRAAACGELATFTERGWGTAKDEKAAAALKLKATAIYTAACERGDATACYTAGACHEFGSYVDVDPERAAALYQLGCDGGEGASCFALGAARHSSGGAVKDPEGAAPILKKACDLGSSASCQLLGRMLAEGEGVPRDALRGRALLERACFGPGDARLGAACTEAAVLRLDLGESRLSDAVRTLVIRGCDLGDAPSCTMRDTSNP